MATSTDRRAYGAAAVVFALFAALYVSHAAHGPVAGDGPELVITAHTLGIPHPSGYPLFTLVTRLVALAPDPTRALHLFHAIAAALACGLVTLVAARTAGAAGGMLAGLMLGGSASLVREATRFEVYAVWLVLLALLLLCVRGRPLLFGYLAGLACAHHLAILFLAPALALAGLRPGIRPARAVTGLALFALGLSAYAYLPVRATLDPAWNWGDPSTLARFLDHVSGRGYWGYAAGGGLDDLVAFAQRLPREVSWAGVALVPLGLLVLARRRAWREFGVLVLGIAGIVFYIGRYGVNDPEPYFLPVVLFASLALAHGWSAVARRVGRAAPVLAAGVGAVLVLGAWSNARDFDRSERDVLAGYTRAILQTLEVGSCLVVEGDAETFGLFHALIVDGERTDVTLYNSLFDVGPEGPVFAKWNTRGASWKRQALRAALRAGTPVYTVVEQDVLREPGYALRAHGLLFRWFAEGRRAPDIEAVFESYDLSFADRVESDDEYLERWIAGNVLIRRARHAYETGDEAGARRMLARAESLAEGNAPVFVNAGRLVREWGDSDEALRLFRAAGGNDGDVLAAWNEVDLLIAQDREPARTVSLLEWIRARDPRLRASATWQLARIALRGGDRERARALYRELLAGRPGDIAGLTGLWETAVLDRDAAAAETAYQNLAGSAPDAARDRALTEASFFEDAGRYEEADSIYARRLTRDNEDPHDWNAAAWALANRPVMPPRARDYVDRGLSLAPADPYLLDTKGWVLYREGEHRSAAACMDRALAIGGLSGAGPRYRRAIVAHALGDAKAAERWAEEASLWRADDPWRMRYSEASGGF